MRCPILPRSSLHFEASESALREYLLMYMQGCLFSHRWRGFLKLGVPSWGPDYKGILLFGDYIRGTLFSKTPPISLVVWIRWAPKQGLLKPPTSARNPKPKTLNKRQRSGLHRSGHRGPSLLSRGRCDSRQLLTGMISLATFSVSLSVWFFGLRGGGFAS